MTNNIDTDFTKLTLLDKYELLLGGGEATDTFKNTESAESSIKYVSIIIKKLLQEVPINLQVYKDEFGLILLGDLPVGTIVSQIITSSEKGHISPMLYAAANAGAAISMAMSAYQFHGPTINITVPSPQGILHACLLASAWLTNQTAKVVFLLGQSIKHEKKYCTGLALTSSAYVNNPTQMAFGEIIRIWDENCEHVA